MSAPEDRDTVIDEEEQDDIEGLLEVSFHFLNCLESDVADVGVSFRRSQDGDIVPGSMVPFGSSREDVLESAITAAASATDERGRRRRRVPPIRPPRPQQPILTWDEIRWPGRPVAAFIVAREREASEIATPRELDNEPDRSTWPITWDTHHDYFLWACRGTVTVITDHLQAIFALDPPIEETFVAARLGGVNAFKQMTFLRKWLPGETHSLQRAEARGVVYEADISHPDVRMGSQLLDLEQLNPGNEDYKEPVLPCWCPRNWGRTYDSLIALYLGEHPDKFLREYNWAFENSLNAEFVRIRMAQIPHLNLTWQDLSSAQAHRALLLANDIPGDDAHAMHLI
ncbi:hypothetical protein BJY04DRAFT_58399 [Aspergillus karnatakaensis]|uniref:uncharacterized protein n=1 Tax=Aspergillus karnatakaensis TaxID=1810916 RepID=UPI003CCE3252